jgi:aspartate dehydrogenase
MFHMRYFSQQNKSLRKLGVIGYGAVGTEIVDCLLARKQIDTLVGVLDVPTKLPELLDKAKGRFPVVSSLAELLASKPDFVIEAAGHAALRSFGVEVVASGIDLLTASVGAFTDDNFAQELVGSAAPGAELWIAAGAVAGIDGLLAARTLGPRSVTYTSIKPPVAWVGTPAELLLVNRQTERVAFFEGSARDAAALYPQNANVAATVALACLGLDRTKVQLVSDPSVSGPVGIIEAAGDFGYFNFEILALASQTNPKTSAITGHSLVSAAHDGMSFRAMDLLRQSC